MNTLETKSTAACKPGPFADVEDSLIMMRMIMPVSCPGNTQSIRRLYISLIFLFVLIARIDAQTLHCIIFTNTNDRTIGRSAARNTVHIQNLADTIAARAGFTKREYVYTGDDYTFERLNAIITSIQVGKDDAILFYLNSHGFKSSSDSKFPRIVIKSPMSNRYLLSSDKVNQELWERCNGCALNLTIIQACNRVRATGEDLEIIPLPALVDFSQESLRKLFHTRENILVTSSQRGKTSIALPDKGSVFTMCLKKALLEISARTQPDDISWEKVFAESRRLTRNYKGHKRRTPVWSIVSTQ